MPDLHAALHRADASRESRFQRWLDRLVDPVAGPPPDPDRDIVDIASTARDVVRAAGVGSATSLAPDRIDAMWEQIMSNTTMTRPVATSATGARVVAPRGGVRLVPPSPTSGWRRSLTTAALIAVLVLAGVATVWRIAGPFGGTDPDTARQPGIAGLATPGESPDGCPLTSDVPLFLHQAPSFTPSLGTAITYALVQPDGDLVILCDGVDDPEPLVTGVTDATALGWPGTVLLEIEGDAAVAYNVATGESIELGNFETIKFGHQSEIDSPWLLSVNNAAHTDWRLTNLETMRSLVLSDEIGGVLPDAMLFEAKSSPDSSVAVITEESGLGQTTFSPNPAGATVAELPGDSLIVDETFETRRWVEHRGDIALSPDGEAIAFRESGIDQPLRVEDARSGETLAEFLNIEVSVIVPSRLAFAGDGESLVLLHEQDIWIATYGDEPTTTRIDSGDTRPSEVHTTAVPGRLLVTFIPDEPVGRSGYPNNPTPAAILDTESAELTDVEGVHAPPNFWVADPWQHLDSIVTMTPSPQSGEMTTFHLFDIVTGEVVLSSDPVEVSIRTMAEEIVQPLTIERGGISVARLPGGISVLFDATTRTVLTVPPPASDAIDDVGEMDWQVVPSQDGDHLYAYGSIRLRSGQELDIMPPIDLMPAFAIAAVTSDPEWSVTTDGAPIGVIPGIPSPQDDDLVVLDAQDIPPLDASPAATPATAATPVAADASCDLTGDLPIVTSADVLPWDGTVLVHADDTLTAHCDGGTEVIAEGVSDVRATGWPGTIIVTTTDGTLRGLNLITGASAELGPVTVPAEEDGERLFFGPVSRWLFLPTDAQFSGWRIVDLQTMEALVVSDVPGASLPDRSIPFPRASAGETTLAISFYEEASPTTATTALPTPVADAPGMPVLVVDGSLDTVRWTEAAPGYIAGASLSPDGDLLALTRETESGLTVDVQRTSDGEPLVETGIAFDDGEGDDDFLGLSGGDDFLVLDDEAGLLHLSRLRLDLVTWNDAGETETTTLREFAVEEGASRLYATADPAVVIVAMGYGDFGRNAYRVDVATRAITEMTNLIGETVEPISNSTTLPRYGLAAVPTGPNDGRTIVRIVDLTSGEVVVESDPVDLPIGDLALRSAYLMRDGAIGLVSISPDRALMLDAGAGEVSVIDAPSSVDAVPEGTWWYFFAGGDGGFITAMPEAPSVTSLFILENDPDAEWVELSPESLIAIVPGMDATVEP